jgi:hypothetical protein
MARWELAPYGGWNRCLIAQHDGRRLVLSTEVGPRILHWSLDGGANVLGLIAEDAGVTGGGEYRLLGGHRLWHAPEAFPRCYEPDLAPVQCQYDDAGITVVQQTERTTGIRKSLRVEFLPGGSVRIQHILRNDTLWPVELAAWAMTIVAAGTRLIVPQEPFQSHPEALSPARSMTLWSYTRMNDPRVVWGQLFIQLREDPGVDQKFKVGLGNRQGWAACWSAGSLFIKTFAFHAAQRYPDMGCNFETFTGAGILEVESLSPLRLLVPGAELVHEEVWHLWPLARLPENDADLQRVLEPYLPRLIRPQVDPMGIAAAGGGVAATSET